MTDFTSGAKFLETLCDRSLMDSRILVIDISSDEEGDDYDWISELLDEPEREGDDSDAVGLVSGVVVNPKQRSETKVKDLDDDCVVLDGDPDKPIVVENSATGDLVDLFVVGEKGEVACRDYPHSRHLCANFPFTSTPHERHCPQCHCYVCDTLAPCVDWGNGTSCIDHCHASDKNEFWIYQRQGAKAPLPLHKLPDSSSLVVAQQQQQNQQWLPLTQLQPNSRAHDQISSMNFGIPNITNRSGSQQYAHITSRNKFQPQLVSQHLLSARNDVIQTDRRHNSCNLGPYVINSRKVFKRAGSRVALAKNLFGYAPFCNELVTQYFRNAHSNMGSMFVNSVPSQTQDYSQPIPAVYDYDTQVFFQQVNRDFSALDPRFSAVDTTRWIPPTGQSNQHYLVDNSQIQSAEFDPQVAVNTNPGSLDIPFDISVLENQSVLGGVEPSGLSLYSPEHAHVDTNFVFDF